MYCVFEVNGLGWIKTFKKYGINVFFELQETALHVDYWLYSSIDLYPKIEEDKSTAIKRVIHKFTVAKYGQVEKYRSHKMQIHVQKYWCKVQMPQQQKATLIHHSTELHVVPLHS